MGIPEMIDFVINKKFIVSVYEENGVLYEDFEWSLQEISLFLMTNKTYKIHLYKEME